MVFDEEFARLRGVPVGFFYLLLLVLVAAPLRRSGAFTLPDFAQGRLGSPRVRAGATTLVVVIGWLYLIPQMQGAGLTLRAVVGAPSWVGVLTVGLVVLLTLATEGAAMDRITGHAFATRSEVLAREGQREGVVNTNVLTPESLREAAANAAEATLATGC